MPDVVSARSSASFALGLVRSKSRKYNLIDMDLCWHPGIITSSKFTEFVREVKEDFRKL